jgi:hypothetical protein
LAAKRVKMIQATGKPRGRPNKSDDLELIVLGNLRLHKGDDDDLIQFFRSIPSRKRHAALKAALRAGGMKTIRIEDLSDDEELEEAAEEFL